MAKIPNGILGNVIGKVGNVVGFVWKGINVIRGYAVPENPQTEDQMIQRGLFGKMQAMASSILITVLQKFWKAFAIGVSEYNAFISYNLKDLFTGSNYNDLLVTRGNIETTTAATGVRSVNSVNFTWEGAFSGNGLATDRVGIVLYDTAKKVSYIRDGIERRSEEASAAPIDIPSGAVTNELRGYIWFYRTLENGTIQVSNSFFFQPSEA